MSVRRVRERREDKTEVSIHGPAYTLALPTAESRMVAALHAQPACALQALSREGSRRGRAAPAPHLSKEELRLTKRELWTSPGGGLRR